MPSGRTVERRASARYCVDAMFGLEALGGDALVEGQIKDVSKRGVRAIVPSLLPDRARAFAVMTPPGEQPIVAMIEVLEQTVVIADAAVELRAQFVDLSSANENRLHVLCAHGTVTSTA
jgi:hypothetical protein